MKNFKILFIISLMYALCQTSFANDSISTTKKNTFGITYRQRTIALNYERLLHQDVLSLDP